MAVYYYPPRKERREPTEEEKARWKQIEEERKAERKAQRDAEYKAFCAATRWARCSAGSKGWYWYVRPSWDVSDSQGVRWYEAPPIASGFEPTMEAAEEKAKEIAGPTSRQDRACMAAWDLRQAAVEKRMARKPKGEQADRVEFVWEAYLYASDDWRFPDKWIFTPYRVVRKTAKRVYVEVDSYEESQRLRKCRLDPGHEETWRDHDVKTFVLDRSKLESEEGARPCGRRSYRWSHFYATREAAERSTIYKRGDAPRPRWAEIMGLDVPCTRHQVKAAYRKLSKLHHPDAGGDEGEFVRLETAYREALAAAAS